MKSEYAVKEGIMKNRIIGYVDRIDKCLSGEIPVESWEELLEEHLIQTGWFQHERIVHMFIMLAFALFTVGTIVTEVVTQYLPLCIVVFMFLILTIPYIKHYFLMENKCQRMLFQYDEIWEKVRQERRENAKKLDN